MSIEEIQNEIIDEFAMFEDWEERYQYMIDLGKDLPLIDDQYKTDSNIIKGYIVLIFEIKLDEVL